MPKFVTSYMMSGNRCKNDAAAICEAEQRPSMRFVPVKSTLAQARLAIHTEREGWVKARTACINRLPGLLSEFGIVLPLKAQTVQRMASDHLDDLPGWSQTACRDLLDELRHLDTSAWPNTTPTSP